MGERKSYRIHGLTNAIAGLNGMLFREACDPEPDLLKLRSVLQQENSNLVRSMNAAGIQVGNLPTRSMRAAAWILFMQREDHLRMHVSALQRAARHLTAAGITRFNLAFSYSSYLFRYQPMKDLVQISFHEGYIDAPADIYQALVRIGTGGRGKSRARELITEYARSVEFKKIKENLEQFSRAVFVEEDAAGYFYNLRTAFERVNWAYFNGEQNLPHLCWSGTVNYRKLGHYNPVSDTIQVSSLLDHKQTPEYVVDFILYHEMLHRQLGIVECNQRQLAHRAEFRQQEQDFAHYEAAQRYMRQLASLR